MPNCLTPSAPTAPQVDLRSKKYPDQKLLRI